MKAIMEYIEKYVAFNCRKCLNEFGAICKKCTQIQNLLPGLNFDEEKGVLGKLNDLLDSFLSKFKPEKKEEESTGGAVDASKI